MSQKAMKNIMSIVILSAGFVLFGMQVSWLGAGAIILMLWGYGIQLQNV